jgi:peroxiredoxin
MSRRIVLVFFLVGLFTLFSWLSWKIFSQLKLRDRIEVNSQFLPDISLVNTDSTSLKLHDMDLRKKTFVFYFDSDCENCKQELQDFKKDIQKFRDVNVLWVSKEDLSKIKQFESQLGLKDKLININVAKISAKDSDETFGFTVTPSIFIYAKNRKLEKKYIGQTRMEILLKFI